MSTLAVTKGTPHPMIRVTSLLWQIQPPFRNLMSMFPSSMQMWDSSVARRVSIISWIQRPSELVSSTIQHSVQRVQATTRQLPASTKKYARASYCSLFHHPSLTLFIPGLKLSFSANPSHCRPSFLLLKYLLCGFPGLFTVISEHICFLLLNSFFLFFLHFLVEGSVTHVGFRAHVKMASRIVSFAALRETLRRIIFPVPFLRPTSHLPPSDCLHHLADHVHVINDSIVIWVQTGKSLSCTKHCNRWWCKQSLLHSNIWDNIPVLCHLLCHTQNNL